MSPDDTTPDVPDAEEPQELLTGSAPQEGETEPTPGDATVAEESSAELVTGSAPQEGEGEEEPEAAKPKRRAARTRKAKVVAEASAASEEPQVAEAEEAAATVIAKVPDEAAEADEADGADEAEEPQAAGDEEAEDADEAPQPTRRTRAKAPAAAESPEPAPRRSRPAARRAVVRAQAKYVRTSARKARMVCGHIRGKSVDEARAILAFTPRDVARDWSKLLESAVANAENNHELVGDDLIVQEAYADEGPTIKRFRPRAMGRATPIRKRTSHLTITLTPRS